ncbi:hypothetical protein K474DRAFT_1586518 [Panus rudis PR-1116 ss-1]|nr:hypothetical protein K474DRAFT_1586518 [Panus rudis PR-1116 ss-1]
MDGAADDLSTQHLFTCLSCSIAFYNAEDQRVHYRSDHHRYNMKRRVAGLPPVSAEVFNQKVLERQSQTAVAASPKGSMCSICGKTYTTENAYRSHLSSKKHKENELKAAKQASMPKEAAVESPAKEDVPMDEQPTKDSSNAGVALTVDAEATEEEIIRTIDEKIAAARARLSPSQCLFCPSTSSSIEENIAHMSTAHSFFIPDTEFLDDLPGLLTYLGEKIAVGNVCIYCNAEFRTVEAVRKHMVDKGHCKIAYDTENERLEVSDFYDFTSSYPDADKRKKRKQAKESKEAQSSEEGDEWEDMEDDGGEVDEVVEIFADEDSDLDDDDYRVTFGDSPYELILPSGSRISHRHTHGHHRPSTHLVLARKPRPGEPGTAAAQVKEMLKEKNSSLVPAKGGFGAFGGGLNVVRARNAGEAREAGRHVREFRDIRRREYFKTKVGFRHNNQKHFRDPLLQVRFSYCILISYNSDQAFLVSFWQGCAFCYVSCLSSL